MASSDGLNIMSAKSTKVVCTFPPSTTDQSTMTIDMNLMISGKIHKMAKCRDMTSVYNFVSVSH